MTPSPRVRADFEELFQEKLSHLETRVMGAVERALVNHMVSCELRQIVLGDPKSPDPRARAGLDDTVRSHFEYHKQEDRRRQRRLAALWSAATTLATVLGYFAERLQKIFTK